MLARLAVAAGLTVLGAIWPQGGMERMRITAILALVCVGLVDGSAIAEDDRPAPTPPTVIVTDEDVLNQQMDNERRMLERTLRRDAR
ncbi:hypothetical protein KF840_19250 [bacterium]|nr:hypothetical protein [bacterium]